ncbi:MAG: alpha-amylase family glycosyl hydrolase [Nanobdellota archaeon]
MSGELYQWEKFLYKKSEKDISEWSSNFGPSVIQRQNNKPKKVKFKVLIDNPKTRIFIVGDFNNWGEDLENYELKHDKHSIFAEIVLECIKHKEPYKFLVKTEGKSIFMQDPAGHYFDHNGNTIFWDFEHPSSYKLKHGFIDTINRSTRVLQTDLPGLIMHWADKSGVCGRDLQQKEYYKFITNSGILEHIKKLGFNTIQFLPFAQSIDGDNWKFRYLIPFQFAIQKNWGTPDDFKRMIDKCHEQGIAVIGDFVIGHLPFKKYMIFGQDGEKNGIQQWYNRHGTRLYMKEETPWGTMRIDYDNPNIRDFIISSCLHFLQKYRIDGLRIDNVDGIIRYGENGDGPERPNGRKFLRELNKTLYTYNPCTLIHFESHYFHEDNAKMLVIPFEQDKRALGATAYNSSRMTYYFHTEYMPKAVDEVTPWKFKDITEEKEWGQSSSTIADFHNHDAAAGLIPMRCTGSYAYDAMTVKQPQNHIHAIGKIKVMEAIISFCCEGRTLDLAQTFLLQTGTFEHESSIKWFLAFNQVNNNMTEYKRKINTLMEDKAFWPINTKNRRFLNIDDKNKMLVVKRESEENKYVIVINLSSWTHMNYKVGLDSKKDQEVMFNSDLFDYAGLGLISFPKTLKNEKSVNFELLEREVVLPKVAPYHVVILKEKK